MDGSSSAPGYHCSCCLPAAAPCSAICPKQMKNEFVKPQEARYMQLQRQDYFLQYLEGPL